jgi:hypothetical protein
MSTRLSFPRPKAGRVRTRVWTWLAGADDRVLALVPSERSFLEAQGMVIFAMACVTGFAVAVAASGWWDVPVTNVLWLGIAWTVVICIIDRLIYKSFGTGRKANLALAVPRAALSVCSRSSSACRWCSSSSVRRSTISCLTPSPCGRTARTVGDRVLRTEDQSGERTDRSDRGQGDNAAEPREQVHPPERLRRRRTVVLTHASSRLRALVPLLRATGEQRTSRL